MRRKLRTIVLRFVVSGSSLDDYIDAVAARSASSMKKAESEAGVAADDLHSSGGDDGVGMQ